MTFQRNIEDFTCEHCGAEVEGNGYTNHCPRCLWGKHVDIHPGDRAERCGGMMGPVAVTRKGGEERILHRCIGCGFERENRVSDEDDRESILRVAKDSANRLFKE